MKRRANKPFGFGHLHQVYEEILLSIFNEAKRYSRKYPIPAEYHSKTFPHDVIFYFLNDELNIQSCTFGNYIILSFMYNGMPVTFQVRFCEQIKEIKGATGEVLSYNCVIEEIDYFSMTSVDNPKDRIGRVMRNYIAYEAMIILYTKYYNKLISDFSDEFWYLTKKDREEKTLSLTNAIK